MNKTILITGASSGIGAACISQAATRNLHIIATARNRDALLQLQTAHSNVQIIVADIATDTGRNHIAAAIKQPIDYLLHNAAILDQPTDFSNQSLPDFRNNIVTNVEPIIFLTQKLLPQLHNSHAAARILSMSSGAATSAIAGIGNYCISKAAALMANALLKIELRKYQILVNDYFPGVVDTNMQKTLRQADHSVFPYALEFNKLKQENNLAKPMAVADHIIDVFCCSSDEEFVTGPWKFNN